jgi:predicted Zn-dependent protease
VICDHEIQALAHRLTHLLPHDGYASARWMRTVEESVYVRQDIVQPSQTSLDEGVMFTVHHAGGIGYGATSDLSDAGLRRAVDEATAWARITAKHCVFDPDAIAMPHAHGEQILSAALPWRSMTPANRTALARSVCASLKVHPAIVDWDVIIANGDTDTLLVTNRGGLLHRRYSTLMPHLSATANEGPETITRTLGMEHSRHMGFELLDEIAFRTAGQSLANEAVELLSCPQCPSGTMDVLLAPDQMHLQIHESIGHPLELDRILGDERNYAGTSFVTPDMFGHYRYGSPLLNVTFDPSDPTEMGSYPFDDEGATATRQSIIKDGILLRPLGGTLSQARAGIPGVANARASSWNRPPVDRMACLNLEPGTSSMDEMISSIDSGVYMQTNCSWSIDDSRNKFQFGCEVAHVIHHGKIAHKVKRPNYRGVSATFWRNLLMVGNPATRRVLGATNCGKAEPNQMIFVGHATQPCVFASVDVFGGAE